MMQRAQPLAGVSAGDDGEDSVNLVVPIRFSLR